MVFFFFFADESQCCVRVNDDPHKNCSDGSFVTITEALYHLSGITDAHLPLKMNINVAFA